MPEPDLQRIPVRKCQVAAQVEQARPEGVDPVILILDPVIVLLLVGQTNTTDIAQLATGSQSVITYALVSVIG